MASFEIPKVYEPKSVEPAWAEFWVREGYFQPKKSSASSTYVIVIPPPNVTGSLHMGHALNNTLQDVLIRWKRMCGFETLWVPGTDHGGIATQNVVEKLLKAEKKSRADLGREKFLERMWQWRKESGDTILMQLRRLGCSLDWNRARFTMDEVCSRAVAAAFLELFKKGWIYRGKRMVNWCVRCQTALSDIEVEYEERKDKLYYLRYPILSGVKSGWQGVPLVVATTRPETMLGDTAVAVHPEDPRYEKIHGWWVQLPLMDREIEVIADGAVDPKFGTGVVKVTPAHDPLDYEMGERHHLKQKIVIGFDGRMTAEAGKYAGLSREECRKKVLEDLAAQGLLEKVEDYHHSVGVCYRCGVTVEPLVSDQWFLKVDEMAKKAIQASKEEKVKIFPENWNRPYLSWLENLRDWCISRQIWWGHRIPIWYCLSPDSNLSSSEVPKHPSLRTKCPPLASLEKPDRCPCGNSRFGQDPDVLDTWFSSGLWPFSVFGWPEKNEELKKYYPTAVLVTGHEILYLWVARMVMMGLTFMNGIPFSHVYIHGIVRDKQGRKMSKSLGNVIDPLTMMDKFGTDALRFVLVNQSVPGRDMQISEDTFVGARNFANKIWNVSRFVLTNLASSREKPNPSEFELCDRWILSRYQRCVKEVDQSLKEYNLAQSARALYQFVWSEFCDWYVELSKIRILKADSSGRGAALHVLQQVLEGILKSLHPVMPFITEELWRNLNQTLEKESAASILETGYPQWNPQGLDEKSELEMELLMNAITEIRTIRSEMSVPPGSSIQLFLNATDPSHKKLIETHSHYFKHLCKVSDLKIGTQLQKPAKSASSVAGAIEIFVPLEGLIDFGKEKMRLQRELQAVQKELEILNGRLSQDDFKTRAPEEEVKRTEQRKLEASRKLTKLNEHLSLVGE